MRGVDLVSYMIGRSSVTPAKIAEQMSFHVNADPASHEYGHVVFQGTDLIGFGLNTYTGHLVEESLEEGSL